VWIVVLAEIHRRRQAMARQELGGVGQAQRWLARHFELRLQATKQPSGAARYLLSSVGAST